MKIKKLIEELKKLDQEEEIYCDCEDGYWEIVGDEIYRWHEPNSDNISTHYVLPVGILISG
jgi:hypothetical protein